MSRLLAGILVAAFELYHEENQISCTDLVLVHAAVHLHAYACGRTDE